jgi:hypothetical protein
VVLSTAHLVMCSSPYCRANLRMSFGALHRPHVLPLHLNG